MFDIIREAKGLVSHGVSACAGCGLELIIRNVLEVTGENTTIVIPPGCSALFCGFGNEVGIRISGLQGNLENTAAYAAGIRAGYEVQGNFETTVLGFAGDGATVDIGLQSLSGALERRDKILYICYDNEAYMNTGIQGSSSSPMGAWTTTTPGGKPTGRKDLLRIAMAHDVPYCASASIAYLPDLKKKVKKAMEADGPAVLHIQCPCPTGWGYQPAKTIEVARNAVQSGAWVLYEYEDGKIKVNVKPKEMAALEDYLRLQGRFRDVKGEKLEQVQQHVRGQYELMLEREGKPV